MCKNVKELIKRNKFTKFLYDKCFDLFFKVEAFFRYIKADKRKFRSIKDSTSKRRCFIIGNGPSLRIEDLEKLKEEDCFAVNRVFRIFDQTEWRPTYYCSHDTRVLKEVINELSESLGSCRYIFLNSKFRGMAKFNSNNNPLFFYGIQKEFYPEMPSFSDNILRGVYEGYTVVYTCIQLAVYMGYKEIYLIGLDHNYSAVMTSDGKIKEQKVDANYMKGMEGANYFLPQLDKTELAYKKARLVCEENGIIIKNATRGGKLEIFDRVDFDRLFEEENEPY